MHRLVQQFPQTYLRFALLASLAAGVAFGIGSLLAQVSAVVAAITALISVRPTFHNSMKESLIQVFGTLLGAGLAFGLVLIFGEFTAVVLTVTTLICFLLAKILKIGEEGALTLAITVFLVAGFAMNVEAVENRFLGVILGVLCATFASLYISPGTPTQRIQESLNTYGVKISESLDTLAEILTSKESSFANGTYRKDLELVVSNLAETRRDLSLLHAEAENVKSGAKWSPFFSKKEVENTVRQVEQSELISTLALNISLEFLSIHKAGGNISVSLAESLSQIIEITADKVAEYAQPNKLTMLTQQTTLEQQAISQAKEVVRNLEDTRPLLLGGVILSSIEKISHEIAPTQDISHPEVK